MTVNPVELTVEVSFDGDAASEQINEVRDAVEEFREAAERLDELGVSVTATVDIDDFARRFVNDTLSSELPIYETNTR